MHNFSVDIRVGRSVGWMYGPHICGDSLDIKKDQLLTGSYSDKEALQLWSISQRKLMETIQWGESAEKKELPFLYTAQFGRSGEFADYIGAGGAGLNEFRLFNQKNGNKLVGGITLPKTVTSADFAYNHDMIAIGCGDGKLRVFVKDERARKKS